MIPIILLFLAIFGSVALLTMLYFLVISASDESIAVPENNTPDSDSEKYRGDDAGRIKPMRAVIHCLSYPPEVPVRFRSEGYTECKTLNMVFGGNLSCTHGCFGLGSCAVICPNDAFVFRNGHVYISDACNGCGFCIHVCPKKLIELVPVSELASVKCAAYGSSGIPSSCQTALDANQGVIDYRKFPVSGFKILHKWGILSQKSR
jgi:Predicted NADH:ubiquinone oxidoreductase, subunit RnfB